MQELLEQLGLPVAYYKFEKGEDDDPISTPFLVWYDLDRNDFYADSKPTKKIQNIRIELYFDYKDTNLENNLEILFEDNEIPYSCDGDDYIDTELMFMRSYSICRTL